MARTSLLQFCRAAVVAALTTAPVSSLAVVVNFGLGADDFGSLTINNVPLCTYDNIYAAGGCNGTINMTPGVWYDIVIQYQNRLGTDGMALSWDQPGDRNNGGYGFAGAFPNLVPKANLQTRDLTGAFVSGLRGDYTGSCALQPTVIGEGPINAINNIYNNQISTTSWNGCGYSSLFSERLSGQIRLSASGPTIGSVATGLGRPFGVAINGGFAYVPNPLAHSVWRIHLATGAKVIVAGTGEQGFNGDGIDATLAQLNNPSGVAVDASGNLYIADTGNHAIRKVAAPGTPGALISTVAGIPTSYAVGESTLPACANPPPGFAMSQCAVATGLRLFGPRAVALDAAGNLYIADRMNQQIKRLDAATRFLFVVAGVAGVTGRSNGAAVCLPTDIECFSATFNSPVGIAVDANRKVYVADEGNNQIRIVTPSGVATRGSVTTLGTASLLRPTGVALAANGDVYIADYGNHVIRLRSCPEGCFTTTVAGTGTAGSSGIGGPATSAQLNSPIGVALDGNVLYIADMLNGRILAVNLAP